MIRLADHIAALAGWRRAGVAFAAGAVSALAMPPIDAWPVLAATVPVMLLLLGGVARRDRRQAFLAGWSFGFGYFVVALHWIGIAFLVDAATYLWMMPFAVGGLAAVMAIYWGLAALLAHGLCGKGLRLAFGFAAAMAVAEWLRGHLFTGFPWAAPGLAVDGMGPVSQAASLIGMTGLTLLVMLWAGLPVVLWPQTRRRGDVVLALCIAAFIPVIWVWGAERLRGNDGAVVPGVRLRIVQPDISQDEKWREDNSRTIFDKLKGLSTTPSTAYPRGIADVTHLIWPESAVPFLIDESPVAHDELARLLARQTSLVMGAIRRDPERRDADGDRLVYNSILTFDGTAAVVARYDKWRLVPGGEFLPLAWLLEPLGFRRVVTVPGSFATGPGPVTIDVPGAPPAAMLVCYEAIFPHRLIEPGHRPGWIINVTNDGWFGRSTGPYQHLAQARLRTIEQGLPLVRAANTGISAVVDAYGTIRSQLALGHAGTLDAPLPKALPPTLYARFGDLIMALMVLLGGVFSLGLRE